MKKVVIFLIFLISLTARILTLNQMGRTWDENQYVTQGYKMVELIRRGDFSNPYFYETYEHPPLAKILYGFGAHFDVDHFDSTGNPVFKYDLTYARLISAIAGSFAVAIISLLGWEFISASVGLTAGIILLTTPWFVGLSQLASLESFTMLFFGLAIYFFLKFVSKPSANKFLLTSISVALALNVKQSNFLLFPILLSIVLVRHFSFAGKNSSLLMKQVYMFLILVITSLFIFFLIFPMPWLHFRETYQINHKLWSVTLSQPEFFLGKVRLTREYYYLIYFLITTPVLVLLFFFLGLYKMLKNKNWLFYVTILWFAIPFAQSFYAWRQHGLRYIVEIYEPMALIAAIGLLWLLSYLKKANTRKIFTILFFLYLFSDLYIQKPYYLDYFNLTVGGTKGVYEHKLFQIGWWGEGLREASLYVLGNAPKGSTVGLAVSPMHTVLPMSGLNYESYIPSKQYDYVIVNAFNVLREGFDDSGIKEMYKEDYFVSAAGAHLVTVYKRK